MGDALTNAIVRLVRSQPFYGAILMGVRKVQGEAARRLTPTAAVFVRKDASVGLAVAPDFFEALAPGEQEAVLVHECLHLVNLHLLRGPVDFGDPVLANLAMDLVVNQYIAGLPQGAVLLSSFPDLALEAEQTADHYYERLRGAGEQVHQALADGRVAALDDHGGWDGPSGGQSDEGPGGLPRGLVEAASVAVLTDAMKQAQHSGGWGELPAGVRRRVEASLAPRVDWRRALRRFAGDRLRIDVQTTRKRPNRRFGWDYPGRKPVRGARLLVAVDTSGSISAAVLDQFLAEIDAIAAQAEVLLAEVDAKVHDVYAYRPRQGAPAFRGGGGTSFQVLWDAIAQASFPALRQRPDGIVYLTDGWAPWPRSDLGIPTLWVITDSGRIGKAPFGSQVLLDLTP